LKSAFMDAASEFGSPLSGIRRTSLPVERRREGVSMWLEGGNEDALRRSPIPSSSVLATKVKDIDVMYLPGPPNTRISSLELPPLSLMGMT